MSSMQSRQVLTKMRYSEVGKVLTQMSDIPYAIIKGEPLSILCHGNPGERESSDVDFLLRKKDLGRFEQILKSCGFCVREAANEAESRKQRIICLSGSHQIEPYMKTVFNIPVIFDINFEVYWGEFEGKRIPVEEFLAHTEMISVLGVMVNTLQPVYAFIQLILHHYKEMNSIYHLLTHKTIVKQKMNDIAMLFHKLDELNKLDELYHIAEEYELKQYIFYMLYYTDLSYPSALLKQWLEKYKSPEAEAILNRYGLSKTEYKTWSISFSERLNPELVYESVRKEMTEQDQQKYQRAVKIFG